MRILYFDCFSGAAGDMILGALIVIVSVVKALIHDVENWEYWIAGLAGLAAIAAPFLLGFNDITAALWTSLILGLLVAGLAAYQVFFVRSGSTL